MLVLAAMLIVPVDVRGLIVVAYGVPSLVYMLRWTLRLPTPVRLPSVLIVFAGIAALIGGIVREFDSFGTSDPYPFPSPADAFVVTAYLLFIAAIAVIVRRREPRLTADPVLDGIVGGLAAALINWSLVLPYLQDSSRTPEEFWVTLGFSAVSFTAFVAAILALVVGSVPSISSRLLAIALIVTFCTDVVGNLVTAGVLDGGTVLFFSVAILGLGGAGLLHPSVEHLVDRPNGSGLIRRLSNRRVMVLTFALITPPALVIWQIAVGGTGIRLLLPALGAVTLAPLVLVRLGRLVHQNEIYASQEATLRAVGERLVESESEEDVAMAVQTGLQQIFGRSLVDSGFVLAPFTPGSVGWAPGLGPALRAMAAEIEAVGEPITGQFHQLESVGVPGMWHGGVVVVQRELRAVVLVATPVEVSPEQRNALAALCRQGAIAIRAVERTEVQVRERSEKRFAALIENSSDIVAILDGGQRALYVSPVAERLLGTSTTTGDPAAVGDLVHPDDVPIAARLLEEVRYRPRATAELRLRHENGGYHWFEVIAADLVMDPNVGGILVNARPIDDRKSAEEQLQLSEARFKALVQHSSDLVVVADERERITYASPSAEVMLGEGSGGLLDRHLAGVFRGSDVDWHSAMRSFPANGGPAFIEFGFSDVNGSWRTLETHVTDLRDEAAVGGFVLNARDVTERKTMMRHLRHQATHDTLTGLANRVLVVEELDHMLSHNAGNSTVAAICIDLDDFRDINDSLGQAVGDQVLVAVADRLRSILEFGDQAARIGADEFVVIVERAHGEELVLEIADTIIEQLGMGLTIDDRELSLSASAGIALDHDRELVGEGLLRNSITAMNQAKRQGRSSVVRFERSMRTASSDRLELRGDLARAIGTEQLVVCYQPIVGLSDGVIVGAEALVRWDHPERGRLSPALFVPIAEDAGLVGRLGDQVRATACADLAAWRAEIPGAADLSISVNLSVSEMRSEQIVTSVLRDLRRSGLPPDRLVLEVTESNLLDDTDAVRTSMAALRSNGVRLGIDDFGTGYSSLGYIHRFDFDILKIDRSFVVGLGFPTNQRIVSAVLDLAADLGADVIAEGIESASQEQKLIDLGCQFGQGYLYSRPVGAAMFRRMLTTAVSVSGE